jgi:ribosomal protein S18 acetylase RimI-like enzyme
MSLPILQSHHAPGRDDLIRYFHRTELHWAQQLAAEETQLDVGTALFNPALPEVFDANMVFDASLPEGVPPADAIAEAEGHFESRGGRCRMWVMNPSTPAEGAQPLIAQLLSAGYEKGGYDILHLAAQPRKPIQEVGGLTIIPARAGFRHARELATEAAAEWGRAQLGDAQVMHLEDPQTDALLAIKDGAAVALVTVLTVGEIGCIENLYVAQSHRGQGIGRTMMSRAMEICARSVFRHVFVGVTPTNEPAVKLYDLFGFERIGHFAYYQFPL